MSILTYGLKSMVLSLSIMLYVNYALIL